jgi:hypothetical protein
MDTDSGNIQRQLEEIVARMLPGIVAEQLAALERPANSAAGPRDHAPGWTREAARALAGFDQQLAGLEFNAESPDVTADMRHYHGIAVEARDRAARLLADAGRRNKSKDVYSAIGRGREALIRLGALRDGRPVPLELLTPQELSGAPHHKLTAYTGERFHWSGKGSADFFLDRPVPHRPVLFQLVARAGAVYVRLMERTERQVTQHFESFVYKTPLLGIAGPDITHVKIVRTSARKWVFELLDLDRLSPLEDMTRGTGGANFRHEAGAVPVIAQCEQRTTIRFYAACDCASHCEKGVHLQPTTVRQFTGEGRAEITLPRDRGIIEIDTTGRWSIDFAPQPSGAR